jgi:membrane associated rhomboid family serine protease
MTWVLMVVCLGIFIAMQFMSVESSNQLLIRYGMVPIRYANPDWAIQMDIPFDYYFSFASNLFLHANWTHLIINLWFLWIFADNVEDRMGRIPFLFFYLVCGIFATVLQWFFDPLLAIPVIGASGAIAGVLAAYYFLYPLARVVIWIPLFFLPIVIHIPAIAFLGLWVIIQLHEATSSVFITNAKLNVALWAHLGGFLAGCLLYRFFLKKQPT